MTRRILLMVSSMRGGGSERQVLLLLKHLDRTRFEPHLYLTERAGDLLDEVPSDVPIHAYSDQPPPSGLYFPGRHFRAQVRHLQGVIERHSIDVLYDRTFHMTMLAGGVKQPRIPRISTIVSPPDQAFPLVEKRFRWFKHRRLTRAYHESSRVVAVSDIAADSAAAYYQLRRDSILTIANPVDREFVKQQATFAAPFCNKLAPGKLARGERLTLVCIGRMTEEKGHADLIEALGQLEADSSLPRLKVWMIGDGPLRAELEARARARLNRCSIEFLGSLRNPAPAIAAADALVLPSRFEGMPNVVLEAFALARPVIATRAGGTVELERDEATILWAEPANPASLSLAIRRFIQEPETASRHVASATRLIEMHHDVAKATRRVEELLDAVSLGGSLTGLTSPQAE